MCFYLFWIIYDTINKNVLVEQIESYLAKSLNTEAWHLSVQQLVSCTYPQSDGNICRKGGLSIDAFKYAEERGILNETQAPYSKGR